MDTFKGVVIISIVLSLVSIGFIVVVANDAIQYAKTPDQEYAMVKSKSPVTNNPIANYTVSLSSGKTFYIPNNTTLYESIQVNKTYLFNSRIDFNNKMTLIDTAIQLNRTAT